jgi:hypothetical protein
MYGEGLLVPWSTWRHPKSGGLYTVIGLAPDSTNDAPAGRRYVVYLSHKYQALRVREVGEFLDGRFIPVVEG